MPHFERTVAHMVRALRPGGLIIEHAPFESKDAENSGESATATKLHVSNGGISMAAAMGPSMRLEGSNGGQHMWRKHRDLE